MIAVAIIDVFAVGKGQWAVRIFADLLGFVQRVLFFGWIGVLYAFMWRVERVEDVLAFPGDMRLTWLFPRRVRVTVGPTKVCIIPVWRGLLDSSPVYSIPRTSVSAVLEVRRLFSSRVFVTDTRTMTTFDISTPDAKWLHQELVGDGPSEVDKMAR